MRTKPTAEELETQDHHGDFYEDVPDELPDGDEVGEWTVESPVVDAYMRRGGASVRPQAGVLGPIRR